MTRLLRLFAAAALALGVATTHAAAPNDPQPPGVLSATITPAQALYRATDAVSVSVQFFNPGTVAATLPKWMLDPAGIDRSFLRVTRAGIAVKYLGALVKRRAPLADDLHVIQPGEMVSANVELSRAFDLSAGGSFEVSVKTQQRSDKTAALSAASVLVIEVEARPADERKRSDGLKASGAAGQCTLSQKTLLASVVNASRDYAHGALRYLAGTLSTRYTWWFGPNDPFRLAKVIAAYTNIKAAYDARLPVFDCAPPDCGGSSTFAYVYTSAPYLVHLCDAFWAASVTGTDSKAGTLIHELSHFDVIAGTDDNEYGQSDSHQLVVNGFYNLAVNNADSYEYFAENTPALP